jgi:hypothetical protein
MLMIIPKLNEEDKDIQISYFITEPPTALTLVISSLDNSEQAEALAKDIQLVVEQRNSTTH